MSPPAAAASRPEAGDLARERLLFGLLILLQAALYAWLILGRRLMKTHDTLFEYQIQYLYLAHACLNGDPALWYPYSLHGITTQWFANFQGGLLQNVLLLAGGVPEGTNMLPVFHLGMFLDEFILLLGTWTLSRKFYASPATRFFVSAAVVASSFWGSQFNFNLKILYGIPLLLALIHRFLDEGRRWPLFVAGLFAALQFSGCITYLPGLTLLVVLAYFVVHALLFPAVWARRLGTLRLRPADALIALVAVGVLASVYAALTDGTAALRHYRPGRDADARVPLDTFLGYAGTLGPGRYLDFFLGVTPSQDYSLYCGACVPVLALLALIARPGKAVLHLAVCLLLILLFSTGFLGIVAPLVYELVPPLRYYRYVSLAAPLVKLVLILLAGYGFEALIRGKLNGKVLIPAFALMGGILLLAAFALGGGDVRSLLGARVSGLAGRPETSAILPVVVAGVSTLALGTLLLLASRRALPLGSIAALGLVLLTADTFRWKVGLFRSETVALDDAQAELQRIRPLPFVARRSAESDAGGRYRTLRPLSFDYGTQYDIADGFYHRDPPASEFMVHCWMSPFEALIQANNRLPVDQPLERLPKFRSDFSRDSVNPLDPYSKIIGRSADKIQVFRRAHAAGSDAALAAALNHPDYRGDLLLLSGGGDPAPLTPDLLSANERVEAPVEVLHFDFNRLRLNVRLPADLNGAWLSYSDVWDPGWSATVNGKPVGIGRSFLAYKAVPLEPGTNIVAFEYRAPVRLWGYRVTGLASLVFVGAALLLTWNLWSGASPFPDRLSPPLPCPACGGPAEASVTVEDHEYRVPHAGTYASCSRCRSAFQAPMPSPDQLASFYPPDYHSMTPKGVLGRVRNTLRFRRLRKGIAPDAVVLDYGCGDGGFLLAASEAFPGAKYFGYEIAPAFSTRSLNNGAVTIIEGSLADLLKALPPCRLITMNHVIEHLPDPEQTLSALAGKLLPGGLLEGQTPAAGSLEQQVFGSSWSGYHAPRHTVVFSPEGLETLLKKCGYEDVRTGAAFNPAGVAVSLASCVQKRGSPARVRRQGFSWLFWLAAAAVLAPIDLFSGAPGIVNFSARKRGP